MSARSVLAVPLLFIAACSTASTSTSNGGASPRASQALADSSAAHMVRVVCQKDAVQVDDPVVRAQRDGVHLVFMNPGGAWGFDLHHQSWPSGSSEGGRLEPDTTPDTSAMGPGVVTVACTPSGRSSYFTEGVPTATFTIVDPDGLYVDPNLSCGSGDQFRIQIPAKTDTDPISAFRQVPGVLPSDDFRPPNYPGSVQHWPTFIVFRSGTSISSIGGPWIEGVWHLIVNACPGSSIAMTP
jgi:hypothetical protein